MKKNKLIRLLLFFLIGAFVFAACEDEFTEEDFLNLQSELAANQLILEYKLARENDSAAMVFQQQLATFIKNMKDESNMEALRQAGLLVSYSIIVEDQGGNPIEGATISVGNSSPSAGRVVATTDATGEATVKDVVIGSNIAEISAAGFVPVYYVVDFGGINEGDEFVVVGEDIYPLGRSETTGVVLISSDGAAGSFATVSGTLTAETDLTNTTPEVLADLTVRAIYSGGSGVFYNDNPNATIDYFRFASDNIGTATVDNTTGAWTMTLPAQDGGLFYQFEVPAVQTTQRLVITERNGVALDFPEEAEVPVNFDPNGSYTTSIPSISGAKIEFSAPTAAGRGARVDLTIVPRSIFPAVSDGQTLNTMFDSDNVKMILRSRGSGLQASPSFVLSGGGATTQATLSASLEGTLNTPTVVNEGAGYDVSTPLTIRFTPVGSGNSYDFTVTLDGDGTLPATLVPSGVGQNLFAVGTNVFTTSTDFGFDITSFSVLVDPNDAHNETTPASVTVSCNCQLDEVTTTNGGIDYTGTPSLAITVGSGVAPVLEILDVAFQHSITLNNTGVTVPYNLRPSISWQSITGISNFTTTNTLVQFVENGNTLTSFTLNDIITPNASGNLVFNRSSLNAAGNGLRTLEFSYQTPVVVVDEPEARAAKASVTVDANGKVTGLVVTDVGEGYLEAPTATISSIGDNVPGSGATVALTGFTSQDSGEITWAGTYTITSAGSNFVTQANRYLNYGTASSFTGTTSLWVYPDAEYNVLLNYGTGLRLENVD